jgi:hypothetical protein
MTVGDLNIEFSASPVAHHRVLLLSLLDLASNEAARCVLLALLSRGKK